MEQREQLAKTLKPHRVWAIAFGSAIRWGAFVLPVDWMGMAGPLGVIVENAYGKMGVALLGFALIMGIFTGLNGFYVSTSRLLFAMGREKILSRSFAKLHPKHKTPHIGIFFTMAATLSAPFFGREALQRDWVVIIYFHLYPPLVS